MLYKGPVRAEGKHEVYPLGCPVLGAAYLGLQVFVPDHGSVFVALLFQLCQQLAGVHDIYGEHAEEKPMAKEKARLLASQSRAERM